MCVSVTTSTTSVCVCVWRGGKRKNETYRSVAGFMCQEGGSEVKEKHNLLVGVLYLSAVGSLEKFRRKTCSKKEQRA